MAPGVSVWRLVKTADQSSGEAPGPEKASNVLPRASSLRSASTSTVPRFSRLVRRRVSLGGQSTPLLPLRRFRRCHPDWSEGRGQECPGTNPSHCPWLAVVENMVSMSSSRRGNELGEFLEARRTELQSELVGLPKPSDTRPRVKSLRREEVAAPAPTIRKHSHAADR